MDNQGYIIDTEYNIDGMDKCKKPPPPPREYSFEEAITLTGVGWFHIKLLLICGVCFMSVMVEIMGVSLIMPLVKCDLLATLEQQGVLASAGFLGIVISSHAMGFLADTWGRVATLRYAMAFSAISSIISAFSINIWMLIVCRFFTGMAISGGQACVFSLCGEFHGNRSRIRHVTLLSSFMCIAMMYSPAVAIGIMPLKLDMMLYGLPLSSWRIFLITNLALTLLAILGLSTLPETPKYQLVQGQADKALQTLSKIYAQNTRKPAEEYPVKRLQMPTQGANLSSVHNVCDAVRLVWRQTVPLFHRSRVLYTLNICLSQFLIYCIAQGIFMWFPTVLNELDKRTEQGALLCTILQGVNTQPSENQTIIDSCAAAPDTSDYQVLIAIGAAFTIIYLIFAYTIDIVGKRYLLISWMVLTMICLLLLHWLEYFALVIIALTLVMAIGNCGGLVSTIAIEFYPTQINAMGMCFIMMVGRLGAVVGSNVLGNLLFNSCNSTFWGLLVLVFILSIMSYFLPEKKTIKAKELNSSATETNGN